VIVPLLIAGTGVVLSAQPGSFGRRHNYLVACVSEPGRSTMTEQRVVPKLRLVPVDATRQVFHPFFEINQLPTQGYYGQAVFLGMFEDNDGTRRLIAVADYNHDLGEFWEFSDTGMMPVDDANDAYKVGVNHVIDAMTH
jgi:hypothetical protein